MIDLVLKAYFGLNLWVQVKPLPIISLPKEKLVDTNGPGTSLVLPKIDCHRIAPPFFTFKIGTSW